MFRRLGAASALMAGAALLVTGCSVTPVKMGAAAVTGGQRITIATLNDEVANLSQAAKKYQGIVQLSPAQQTQQTLTWLVRFPINDELASQHGITVTPAQAEASLARIYAQAKAAAQAQGVTNVSLQLILVANGIPPNLAPQVGRYQAIEDQFSRQVNGGTLPSTQAEQMQAAAQLGRAQCVAAKTLDIQVNPQFGRMDYSQAPYQVVSAPSPVSGSPGASPSPSPSGTAPAC